MSGLEFKPGSLADRVLSIVHAFSDKGRKDDVRKLAAEVADLERQLTEALAGAAVMREALARTRACEKCGEDYGRCMGCDRGMDAALASDAGRALAKEPQEVVTGGPVGGRLFPKEGT